MQSCLKLFVRYYINCFPVTVYVLNMIVCDSLRWLETLAVQTTCWHCQSMTVMSSVLLILMMLTRNYCSIHRRRPQQLRTVLLPHEVCVQFGSVVSIAQLSTVSHCTLVATLKPDKYMNSGVTKTSWMKLAVISVLVYHFIAKWPVHMYFKFLSFCWFFSGVVRCNHYLILYVIQVLAGEQSFHVLLLLKFFLSEIGSLEHVCFLMDLDFLVMQIYAIDIE